MLPTKTDDHEVQQLRADEDRKHHRSDLGRLAHHRAKHTGGVEDPAGEQQPEERVEIGRVGQEEGGPAFGADVVKIDPQIEIHPDQDADDDGVDDGGNDFGLSDTGANADGTATSPDNNYTIFWNVAVDEPMPNLKTIRVIVTRNYYGLQKQVALDYCKINTF